MKIEERIICAIVLIILFTSTILAMSLVAAIKEQYFPNLLLLLFPFLFQYIGMAVLLWRTVTLKEG